MWLCLACYFWGIAASMVFSLLPIYVVDELGGDRRSFGILIGSTTFLTIISRVFTGLLIDVLKKRKVMLYIGATLTLISKLLITCFTSMRVVFFSQFVDRLAHGFRHTTIDVMLTDLSQKDGGFSFSLRHAMNLIGYATGSIFTSSIILLCGTNFRLIFALAIIPTIISIYILKEKVNYEAHLKKTDGKSKWGIKDVLKLSNEYWKFMIVVTIIMFNRFNEGFITLRARDILCDDTWKLPLLIFCYEVSGVVTAIAVGKFMDKIDRRIILIFGITILFFDDVLAVFADNFMTIWPIYLLAGIHMGATHWVILLIVTRLAPKQIIGTALAVYYVIEALSVFCSNYLAGGASSEFAILIGLRASTGPFIQGGIACIIALAYLIRSRRKGGRMY
jgi:MFS family permease